MIRQGEQWPNAHDLSSLRLLGSVGEPINPAAWEWYHRVIGKGRCPIVDTWWQTETGGIMIAPMPGAVPLKPGSGTLPMPGVIADIVDLNGYAVGPDRKVFSSFAALAGHDPHASGAIPSDSRSNIGAAFRAFISPATPRAAMHDGYYWVLGRVDDVMNVSGHRLSTMEVESRAGASIRPWRKRRWSASRMRSPARPCAASSRSRRANGITPSSARICASGWRTKSAAFARPEEIRFTDALPKTRSGKIMRRLLREIVTGNTVSGDVTTLEDLSVVARLAAQHDED